VNTLIFPNLEAANITYKLLKELNQGDSIGPIMLRNGQTSSYFSIGSQCGRNGKHGSVAVVDAQEKEKRNKLIKVNF
jgi:malate dehydrogenase (oxaloacetate-decarboxylating)(NADP+)